MEGNGTAPEETTGANGDEMQLAIREYDYWNGLPVAFTDEEVENDPNALPPIRVSLSRTQWHVLTRPTPATEIHWRVGKGNKEYPYADPTYVQATLNQAFGFKWSFEVIKDSLLESPPGAPYEVGVLGCLTVHLDDGTVLKRMQYGSQALEFIKARPDVAVSIGDAYKGAATDAMKKCAQSLGIAADLYDTDSVYNDPRFNNRLQNLRKTLTAQKLAAANVSLLKVEIQKNNMSDDERKTELRKAEQRVAEETSKATQQHATSAPAHAQTQQTPPVEQPVPTPATEPAPMTKPAAMPEPTPEQLQNTAAIAEEALKKGLVDEWGDPVGDVLDEEKQAEQDAARKAVQAAINARAQGDLVNLNVDQSVGKYLKVAGRSGVDVIVKLCNAERALAYANGKTKHTRYEPVDAAALLKLYKVAKWGELSAKLTLSKLASDSVAL